MNMIFKKNDSKIIKSDQDQLAKKTFFIQIDIIDVYKLKHSDIDNMEYGI